MSGPVEFAHTVWLGIAFLVYLFWCRHRHYKDYLKRWHKRQGD